MRDFTQLPNCIWDMKGLTFGDRVLLTHIIRKTIGWGKTFDGISLSQFCNDLETSKQTVTHSLHRLE